MTTTKTELKSRGQAMLETVLLLGIVVIAWNLLSTGLKKSDFFQNLFGEPWRRIANTMEFGIPSEDSRDKAAKSHPTALSRHQTEVIL